jgi:hypothetical protein
MAIIRIIGVKHTTGRTLHARVFAPGGALDGVGADIVLAEHPAGSGQYGARVVRALADTAAEPYEFEVRDVAGGQTFDTAAVVAQTRRDLGRVTGDAFAFPAGLAEIRSGISADHGAGLYTTGILAGTTSGGRVIVAAAIAAAARETLALTFFIAGDTSAGWTAFVFTVKKSAEADDDAGALLTVKISNPGAGGDGLVTLNGRAADNAAAGALTVVQAGDPTEIDVTVFPSGMDIPPSPDSDPYVYGLARYTATGKKTLAEGEFTVAQPVRRSLTP